MTVDALGNLYIADTSNHRIRKVDVTTQVITTVVGPTASVPNPQGFSGDGGPATSAKLNGPQAVFIDPGNNLYIADTINYRIRKVTSATGIINTMAGYGSANYNGDGGAATSAGIYPFAVSVNAVGDVLIADWSWSSGYVYRIRKVDSTGIIYTIAGGGTVQGFRGDGGAATDALLDYPMGIAVDDGGSYFIADGNNGRIRRVDKGTGTIQTVAGGGTSEADGIPATSAYIYAWDVAVDLNGNLYVLRWNSVSKVDAATGIISRFAGTGYAGYSGDGGPAASAWLNSPHGLAVGPGDNLYIADALNYRIRKVDLTTGIITTIAGNGTSGWEGDGGPATAAKIGYVPHLAVSAAGDVYIADESFHRIRKVDAASGIISRVAGSGYAGFSGDGGPATSANLNSPYGVAVDTSGNLLIADTQNHRIRRVDAATGTINTVVGNGTSSFTGDGGAPSLATLSWPQTVAIDVAGNFYIVDQLNQRIRQVFVAKPPGPPSGVNAVAGNLQATVTFVAPSDDGGSPITGYTATPDSLGGSDINAGTMNLSHVIIGLTNGVTYTFTVTASSAAGAGPPSTPSNSVTPASVPDPPTAVFATASDAQATVHFSAPVNNGGSPITGYAVVSSPSGGIDSGGSSTTHVISGLTNGTQYTFAVIAVNVMGPSVPSVPSNSVTPLAPTLSGIARLLVPDGTSLDQTFSTYPETRWFAMTIEPGKTYVVEAVDVDSDLSADAIGTLNVLHADGVSVPPEANVDCTGGNATRPPSLDIASDGVRCVIRTELPSGTLLNHRPVFIAVSRMDPAVGGGSQFKIRVRESTIYGRWFTNGIDYHVELENTTGDPVCVEVVRYPASGLTHTPGIGWSGAVGASTLTVPAFGAIKQVFAGGSVVGGESEGTLRIGACGTPTNLLPGALHVSTYAFHPPTNAFIYFFTSTANEGKTRSTW